MSYCRMNNLNNNVMNMINNQISLELNASHIYTALYSFINNDKQSYEGFAKFFKKSSEEEMKHAYKFIDYQNFRGGDVRINYLQVPQFILLNDGTSTLFQMINFTLNLENDVFDSLKNIKDNCNDSALETFLDPFLEEQVTAQFELATLLRKIERVGNDGTGLNMLDNEMNIKY